MDQWLAWFKTILKPDALMPDEWWGAILAWCTTADICLFVWLIVSFLPKAWGTKEAVKANTKAIEESATTEALLKKHFPDAVCRHFNNDGKISRRVRFHCPAVFVAIYDIIFRPQKKGWIVEQVNGSVGITLSEFFECNGDGDFVRQLLMFSRERWSERHLTLNGDERFIKQAMAVACDMNIDVYPIVWDEDQPHEQAVFWGIAAWLLYFIAVWYLAPEWLPWWGALLGSFVVFVVIVKAVEPGITRSCRYQGYEAGMYFLKPVPKVYRGDFYRKGQG